MPPTPTPWPHWERSLRGAEAAINAEEQRRIKLRQAKRRARDLRPPDTERGELPEPELVGVWGGGREALVDEMMLEDLEREAEELEEGA